MMGMRDARVGLQQKQQTLFAELQSGEETPNRGGGGAE
jgi:hypothetical protein